MVGSFARFARFTRLARIASFSIFYLQVGGNTYVELFERVVNVENLASIANVVNM